MPHRLEITLKPHLADAEGDGIRQKARDYFGILVDQVRTVGVLTIDADLSPSDLKLVQAEIFTNPVTQLSSYDPLPIDGDWIIWVGYRPGVKDNAGSTAVEAIEDLLGVRFKKGETVYTSTRYCLKGRDLTAAAADKIAGALLANDIIQQWKVYAAGDWDPAVGVGLILPKVMLNHTPTVATIPIDSDASLQQVSR
ncbi:MAG: phosphoribosylformylglycinamidine synthase, partial [Desulfobacterales bacterium]